MDQTNRIKQFIIQEPLNTLGFWLLLSFAGKLPVGIPKGLRSPRPTEVPGQLRPDVCSPVAGSGVSPCSRLPCSLGKTHSLPCETEFALMRVAQPRPGAHGTRGDRP